MNHSTQLLKEATAVVPPGARQRVWRRLGEPAARSQPMWLKSLVFAACAAAGFVLVWSFWVPSAPSTFKGDSSVVLAHGQVGRAADGAIHVARGQVLVSSWGAPGIKLLADGTQVETQAALFAVDVAAQSITVDVAEGEVRINGERVVAGARWPSGQAVSHDFASVTALEPSTAKEDRSWALAESAIDSGRYAEALHRFDALGGGGLRAEAALLKKGDLQLRQLGTPLDALLTFDEAHNRFPSGSLGQEVALSSLEALLALENWNDARTRAKDFLTRFPDSERQLEVRYVSALAAWRLDDKPAACSELTALAPSSFDGDRRATLEKLAAQCTSFER
jgi:hypothetical protein